MYFLDPNRGGRRRALLRDKLARAANKGADAVDATAKDLRHRAEGAVATTRARLTTREVPNDVLEARVRSKLGRVVSHPRSIEVEAQDGTVTLRGPILAHEVKPLLRTIRSVPGVSDVHEQLEIHEQAGDVPGLQGGALRPGRQFGLMQTNWSPTTRLLVGSAGGALLACAAGLWFRSKADDH